VEQARALLLELARGLLADPGLQDAPTLRHARRVVRDGRRRPDDLLRAASSVNLVYMAMLDHLVLGRDDALTAAAFETHRRHGDRITPAEEPAVLRLLLDAVRRLGLPCAPEDFERRWRARAGDLVGVTRRPARP
jgi:hypothetical protein